MKLLAFARNHSFTDWATQEILHCCNHRLFHYFLSIVIKSLSPFKTFSSTYFSLDLDSLSRKVFSLYPAEGWKHRLVKRRDIIGAVRSWKNPSGNLSGEKLLPNLLLFPTFSSISLGWNSIQVNSLQTQLMLSVEVYPRP